MLLILGGTYLAYEGAHKVWEKVSGHGSEAEAELGEQGELTPEHEQRTVADAIRTDFILSAEIMVIALNEVVDSQPDAGFLMRAVILAVVAVFITALVYGVVALIVKMDDIGLALAERPSAGCPAGRSRPGRRDAEAADGDLRSSAPARCSGSAATSCWSAPDELGWHAPYDLVHHWEEAVHEAVGGVGALLAWLVNTLASAVIGLVVGAVVVAVMQLVPRRRAHGDS